MWRAPSLDHLRALTDDVGIAQHAIHDIPNRQEGYCTDDVARAFMVALAASTHERLHNDALRLARVYLAFMLDAQLPDGRYHNFMSYARTWLDEVGTADSNGRAMWAMGYGARFAPREAWRYICGERLAKALPHVGDFTFVRSGAYAALGIAHAFEAGVCDQKRLTVTLRAIGTDLTERYRTHAAPDWAWFENEMTYDNARLPEALIRIGTVLAEPAFVELGIATLDFYASITMEDGAFVPIGNAGWHARGAERARFAQQPLEAAALVDAALAAESATGERRFRQLAEAGLEWFYGRNARNAVMATGGGCFDGLEEVGVNRNMGAESTLAYLGSAFALARTGADVLRLAR